MAAAVQRVRREAGVGVSQAVTELVRRGPAAPRADCARFPEVRWVDPLR